ncbi:MAG: hypothetical protein AAGI23_03410 [Bacteroidota bacterium]
MITDRSKVSTSNHDDIKSWATAFEARPTQIKRFESENILDRLKFRFPDESYPDEEDLEWDIFFEIFDREQLNFVMEDVADEAVERANVYEFQPREAY